MLNLKTFIVIYRLLKIFEKSSIQISDSNFKVYAAIYLIAIKYSL